MFATSPKPGEEVKTITGAAGQQVQPTTATLSDLEARKAGTLTSFNQATGAAPAVTPPSAPGVQEPVSPELLAAEKYNQAVKDTTQAALQTQRDQVLSADQNFDTQLQLQRGALYAALLDETIADEDLKWLTPAQQRAVSSGDKNLIRSQIGGLNSISNARTAAAKEKEEKAEKQFNLFLQSGTDPANLPTGFLESLDATMGLPAGTYASIYKANYATIEAERESALLDSQIKLSQYLDTVPVGQSVQIGDHSYMGTDTGQIEINNITGDVYAMREDSNAPNGISITKLGNVGNQTGRQLIQQYNPSTGNYEYWSVNPNDPSDAKPVSYGGGGTGGASNGGVNTNALMEAYPDGEGFSDTSWCLEWIREIAEDGSLPEAGTMNSIDEKAAWADSEITVENVRAGDYILTNEDSAYGHIALVAAVTTNPAGQKVAVLAESNYKGGKVTYGRTLTLSEDNMAGNGGAIMGFHHAQLKSQYTAQPASNALIAEPGTTTGSVGWDNLDITTKFQAKAVSTEIFGMRAGAYPENYELIGELMAQGMTVDEVKDNLRYAGYSPSLDGFWLDASGQVFGGLSESEREFRMEDLERKLDEGNTVAALDALREAAKSSVGVEQQKRVDGLEFTRDFLNEIQRDIVEYTNQGGDLGIFAGTNEQIHNKVGKTSNPELAQLATKMESAVIAYRKSMSGVAFTPAEAEQYANIFPGISKEKDFNLSRIAGQQETYQAEINHFYSNRLGSEAYNNLLGSQTSGIAATLIGKTTANGIKLTDDEAWSLAQEAQEMLNSGVSADEVALLLNKALGY